MIRLAFAFAPALTLSLTALPATALPATALPAPALPATTRTLEEAMQGAIAACAAPDFPEATEAGRAARLAPAGWQPMGADDRAWFLARDAQSGWAWSAYAQPLTIQMAAQDEVRALEAAAEARFPAHLASGGIYRGPQDAILWVDTALRDCLLGTGDDPASAAAFASLPEIVEATLFSPYLAGRFAPGIHKAGGLSEGNLLHVDALQSLFGERFDLSYMFLINAAPATEADPAAPRPKDIGN